MAREEQAACPRNRRGIARGLYRRGGAVYLLVMMLAIVLGLQLGGVAQEPDPAKVDEWMRFLKHEDAAVRDDALKKLVACGEKLLPLLEKYEKGVDAVLRDRAIELRRRLSPFEVDDIFTLAGEAMKADSKPHDWRPKMRDFVRKYVELLGNEAKAKHVKEAVLRMTDAMADGNAVSRANVEAPSSQAVIAEKASGTKAGYALLVAGAVSFDRIDESVVVCLGDVKVRKLEDTILFAKGKVEIGDKGCVRSIVYCAGGFVAADTEGGIILSLGGIEVPGEADGTVWVNAPDRSVGRSRGDREIKVEKLPGKK